MPKKTFTAGEVLTAADVNSFLMDQSVMTFATSAARGSAIGTATEGMVSYLNDTNSLEVFDGSAWNTFNPQSGNAIINGAFDINQRNFTSLTDVAAYTFDRWSTARAGGTVTYSAQSFTLGQAPVAGYEASNFARITTSGQSAASDSAIYQQRIESVRTFAGQTVTLSFFAKASSGSPFISNDFVQNFGSGGSPSSAVFSGAKKFQLSTSWQRFTSTVTIPSISGKTLGSASDFLGVVFWLSAGSDFNSRTDSLGIQSNTFDIWGVQLEAGPVATPFRRNSNSLQGELAACQRYYYRAADSSSSFGSLGTGWSSSTTAAAIFTQFPVNMRVKPTSIEFGNTILSDAVGTFTVSTITLDSNVSSVSSGATTASATGQTQFRPGYLRQNSNSAGFLAFSAEL
jgi:hypothetical protein